MGISTPQLDPFQIFQVSSNQNKTPCLDITYLDEDFRIGRGGNGSLFILIKSDSLPECNYWSFIVEVKLFRLRFITYKVSHEIYTYAP